MSDEMKGLTPAQVKEMGENISKMNGSIESIEKANAENTTEIKNVGDALKTFSEDFDSEMQKMSAQVGKLRNRLAANLGKSGTDDWLNEMAKFINGVYFHQRGRKVPDWCKLSGGVDYDELVNEKAAVDFTTTTDATAGYLVPDLLKPGIIDLKDVYGNLYPLTTKVTMPAGATMKINMDAASPVATWRGTQVTAITEEATPMSFGQDTITTELLGSYIQIANELLGQPGVNFGAVATVRMLKAILRKLETDIISGTTGAGAPSDGLLTLAGYDQGATGAATLTWAHLVTFIQDCLADNPYAYDTGANRILMSHASIMALATAAVGATELTSMLVWGDPRRGVPTTILGYPVMPHPAVGANLLLGDLSAITLGESSSFNVDFSGHSLTAFTENATWLRVFNHYDWNVGQTTEWHTAQVSV